ncbi:PREDICTED: IQ and AAA domain-containing protein 1-like, partial [Gekko japonicus]|uniref:IQ and AAA domain-containing protein 1-like n=1 Tax=Gekko japonicus TaxID=146911 RepID=A0ABM1KDY7_GEKJA
MHHPASMMSLSSMGQRSPPSPTHADFLQTNPPKSALPCRAGPQRNPHLGELGQRRRSERVPSESARGSTSRTRVRSQRRVQRPPRRPEGRCDPATKRRRVGEGKVPPPLASQPASQPASRVRRTRLLAQPCWGSGVLCGPARDEPDGPVELHAGLSRALAERVAVLAGVSLKGCSRCEAPWAARSRCPGFKAPGQNLFLSSPAPGGSLSSEVRLPCDATVPSNTYNKIWAEAQLSLNGLLQREVEEKSQKPIKDRLLAFQMLGTFYIKYVQIFRNLEAAYDQIVHPQKRLIIRRVLDGVMGRILELKNEMVDLEYSEFHYIDDILQDLKLAPDSIDIPIPRYFIKEKLKVLKERERILAQILIEAGLYDDQPKKRVTAMVFEEAVRLIQIAERARQGRLRATFMKQIYLEEKRERQAKLQGGKGPDVDSCAVCIQKFWRGHAQLKKTLKLRDEEMVFLGMIPPAHFQRPSASLIRAQKVDNLRCEIQEKHESDYQQALVSIKDRVKEIEGPDIKESLQDQIRQWFIECRHLTGKFPDYPDEQQGGSTAIFSEKTPEEVAAELAAKEAEEQKKKGRKKGKKDKKEKGKKKTKGKEKDLEKKTKKKDEDEDNGWKMAPSNFLPIMEQGNSKYKDVWQNRDEGWNFSQEYDPELIKEEKRKEVEEEIRVQVDELMRQELKNLKLAVDRETEKTAKKGKRGKKKGRRKGKKDRRKKKSKKEKDLTPDRTIDSLFKELVEEGILIRAKKVKLSDYVGEYSYLGTTLRQVNIEPMPSLADVRQLIALYGILPLGKITLEMTRGDGFRQTIHVDGSGIEAFLRHRPIDVEASGIEGTIFHFHSSEEAEG